MKAGQMKRACTIALAASLVALAGCHSFKKENIEPPTPLEKHFRPTVQVQRLWKARVGDGAGVSGVRLRPAVVDGVLYAVSTDGSIAAFDAVSGKKLWSNHSRQHGWFGWGDKKRKDSYYAGGPAVSGDLLAVGTLDGHVYGFDAKDGKPRWTAELPSEVITTPVIDHGLVVVRTQDGRLYGLDASTGDRRWVYDQGSVPSLSLRGNGEVLAANGVVFYGSDDGKLVALREDNGEKLWEQKLASGEGRTDIDRLDDADGGILLDGSTLYAAAYHGNLTAVDGPSGRPLWAHPFSTYTSLAVHGNAVYGVDDTAQVWAFDKSTGADMWKNDKLRYRWLSAPEVQGDYVVAGDMYGYVHWLQTGDGALAARERLSKKAIRAQPVVVGGVAYIEDVAGHIAAYRLGAR
ncbi:outer membrane protein assembly factor BamB [Fulvimonas sp. R45]|uniref:outer membrane protein assembly factor BamB n=1 Tax=Fulvimonas sp. R45 TaxID=3045937 RepID=UPI00265ED24F|nr:outer membrane protein assembly factor BamB [Fulvimonas sp. R45]MDO1527273.1 outer membrane protein assembly factor BamB [Fulvimonas sp. R45]